MSETQDERPETRVRVRDLHDGLSRYLRRVRQGETFTVTNRSRAVARLIPVDEPTDRRT